MSQMNEWMNEWMNPILQVPLLMHFDWVILRAEFTLRARILPGMGFTERFVSYAIRAFILIDSKQKR